MTEPTWQPALAPEQQAGVRDLIAAATRALRALNVAHLVYAAPSVNLSLAKVVTAECDHDVGCGRVAIAIMRGEPLMRFDRLRARARDESDLLGDFPVFSGRTHERANA